MSEVEQRDRILVSDLLVRGIIGLNEWERKKKQDILVNLELYADIRAAGSSDDVSETVNYRTIAKSIIGLIEGSSYFLVEALATEIARLIVVLGKRPRDEFRNVCILKTTRFQHGAVDVSPQSFA